MFSISAWVGTFYKSPVRRCIISSPETMTPNIHQQFVAFLYSLAVAQITIRFGNQVSLRAPLVRKMPAYSHLVLAAFVVITSWVQWSEATTRRLYPQTHNVFDAAFLLLLVDVFLLICYYILTIGVEIPNKDQPKPASAKHESFWIVVIFFGYVVFDILTKAPIFDPQGPGFWERGWASVAGLVLALIAWALLSEVSGETCRVVVADSSLIGLIMLYRATKQFLPLSEVSISNSIWPAVTLLCFLVTLVIASRPMAHGVGRITSFLRWRRGRIGADRSASQKSFLRCCFFAKEDSMQISSLSGCSTNGLLKMHNGVREALVSDDNTPPTQPKPYLVREFADWRMWADALEAELDKRKVTYTKIAW